MAHTILVDARWIGPHGIGRFADEVLKRLPEHDRLETRRSPLHPLDPIAIGLLLRQRKPRPGVYFSPGFNPPAFSSVPFVFTIHDLIHLRVREESSPAKRAYYRHIVRPGARRAFRVVTVSEVSRHDIAKWAGISPDQIVVAPNAPSAVFTPDGPRHEPGWPYVFHAGNHKPHKNLPRLLSAFARARLDPTTHLVLTGAPNEQLRQLARRAGIGERLVFAGLLSEADLAAHYRGALMTAIPSLDEGFGLPALESMACGTPVLASTAPALSEVVADAALTVDARVVDAMAKAMTRLANDSALRTDLKQRGLARATQFSWDRTAQIVRDVLAAAQLTTETRRHGEEN